MTEETELQLRRSYAEMKVHLEGWQRAIRNVRAKARRRGIDLHPLVPFVAASERPAPKSPLAEQEYRDYRAGRWPGSREEAGKRAGVSPSYVGHVISGKYAASRKTPAILKHLRDVWAEVDAATLRPASAPPTPEA